MKSWLSRGRQAKRYNVTTRSVERWGDDVDLNMPPETEINGRFYRDEAELEAWEKTRVVISAADRAARKRTKQSDEV
jgi:hypothetical protein